jgi:beta-mannan synthase
MIYNFFVARRIVWAFYTFFFFSILVPISVLFSEVQIPVWELIYIPVAINVLTSVGTPRLDHCLLLLEKKIVAPPCSILFEKTTYSVAVRDQLTQAIKVYYIYCRSIHLIIPWFLFENVMALHRSKALMIGFFEAGRANEWIVTQKLGNAQKMKSVGRTKENRHFKDR